MKTNTSTRSNRCKTWWKSWLRLTANNKTCPRGCQSGLQAERQEPFQLSLKHHHLWMGSWGSTTCGLWRREEQHWAEIAESSGRQDRSAGTGLCSWKAEVGLVLIHMIQNGTTWAEHLKTRRTRCWIWQCLATKRMERKRVCSDAFQLLNQRTEGSELSIEVKANHFSPARSPPVLDAQQYPYSTRSSLGEGNVLLLLLNIAIFRRPVLPITSSAEILIKALLSPSLLCPFTLSSPTPAVTSLQVEEPFCYSTL